MRSGWLHIKQIEKKIRSLIPKQPNIKGWNWKKLNKKRLSCWIVKEWNLKKKSIKKEFEKINQVDLG